MKKTNYVLLFTLIITLSGCNLSNKENNTDKPANQKISEIPEGANIIDPSSIETPINIEELAIPAPELDKNGLYVDKSFIEEDLENEENITPEKNEKAKKEETLDENLINAIPEGANIINPDSIETPVKLEDIVIPNPELDENGLHVIEKD